MDPRGRHMLLNLSDRLHHTSSRDDLLVLLDQVKAELMGSLTLSRNLELSRRLEEMEERLESRMANVAAQPIEPPEQEKVITVESLKGKEVLFAIMPYADEFQDVWLGGIKRAASSTGFTPIRMNDITKSADITDEIVDVIKMAKVVVIDVTKNNPNVMFELGFALALKKSHVIISQSPEFLSFDIHNIRTLIYANNWRGIESLHTELQKFIKGARPSKAKKSPTSG